MTLLHVCMGTENVQSTNAKFLPGVITVTSIGATEAEIQIAGIKVM